VVDERDSAVAYMVALFLCLLGCCVLFVHFIIPTIPKKWSDFPAVFLVSLVSLVWSTYVIYSPKQKTQSVVCGCLVLMPLWTDAIGFFFFFLYIGDVWVVDLLCSPGPLPGCCPEV
jgi:cytochrome bd-type quinol oxidase subunit 2